MFERIKLIIDEQKIEELQNKNILIVGVGGVGGSCFEALVRLGIKNITVIDNDKFDISNLNRQILSTRNNIGHSKVLEAKLRGESINQDILIETKEMFLNSSNIDEINISAYDYIIDCCDTMTTKLLLIKESLKYNKKIISSMGTGNRIDASKLKIMNIWQTNYDPVAKVMRKMLRDNNIKNKIPVLCSLEQPIKTSNRTPGSISIVPNVAGLLIANYVLNDIISSRK